FFPEMLFNYCNVGLGGETMQCGCRKQ
ncbi:MAG: hypothetical protein QG660_2342, partial [Pseudomonadota bacterium]|nr:hypothetical protein [Pseudomonadota bacterium]